MFAAALQELWSSDRLSGNAPIASITKVHSIPIVPVADHRVRRIRQPLPSRLLIENASDQMNRLKTGLVVEALPIKASDKPLRMLAPVYSFVREAKQQKEPTDCCRLFCACSIYTNRFIAG